MHSKNIQTAGRSLKEAEKVLIMVHGRGADAEDILALASHLNVASYALLAPQATNHSWYPYSFLMKPEQNQPWLSSALDLLKDLVEDLIQQGIAAKNIYFLGFSQGACLALEFVTRNAKRYGGVAAFTGGLIGDEINSSNYSGDFNGTPIFIGTGNPDAHVPLDRVKETVALLEEMNASVHLEVYENRPHTISKDEIDWTNKLIFKD
ncbi:alpha/beta hydrolase [Sphingobacterium faecium]|uniref:alpha/beta hydrolase n=1 Tax=Sphingobacterium faecium TaxID=34087 RepID=UPI00246885B8|nr:dienelactone hydrolase family protein [Sphingobacterium faecium]MDH5825833.1 dienelactone hydrolase family protein [Sphingobacterium faecium]